MIGNYRHQHDDGLVISYRHLTVVILYPFLLLSKTRVHAFSESIALPTSRPSLSSWHSIDQTPSMLHRTCFASVRSKAPLLVVLSLSRSKSKADPKDDDDKNSRNDLFQEELDRLQLNLRDELKELTYTIHDLQGRSQTRRKKISTITLQNILVSMNVILFLYQILTVPTAVRTNKGKGVTAAMQRWYTSVVTQNTQGFPNIKGTTTLLPNVLLSAFTTDFMFMSSLANQGRQPHRYVTSGFLHGGILHLLLNMRSLSTTPTWLEAGLGKPLYLTVYLLSTVGANLCHAYFHGAGTPTIGSSGAICGLMGYEFILWRKLKRSMNSNTIVQNMLAMLLLGALIPCVSNASHMGGFVTGALLGWFLGPSFTKSYAAKRDRLNYNTLSNPPPQLQRVMGFDLVMNPPLVPLKLFWATIIILCAMNTNTRRIPALIWKGFFHPGSLSRRLE